ncbi:hypothetical protein AALB_0409 [Agarivorans albus MKT 106]|uniref:Uncharacterized protein n=1 Tax=Agarivorans albus MKT 106 TaxID=1331007 RepID=R9PG49_AGAAL|nr:hypothetical protein AALB_0409 [Agarivorans albus MKT 106]
MKCILMLTCSAMTEDLPHTPMKTAGRFYRLCALAAIDLP